MTRREPFEWRPGAPLPTDVPLLSTQIGHCVLHVPPGRWCNWEGLGDPLGIDGFMAGQLGLKLSRTRDAPRSRASGQCPGTASARSTASTRRRSS